MTSPAPRRLTATERLVKHSNTRIVVFEEAKIAFLPMPKSGCTSMLWTLARLDGLDRNSFLRSHQHEVSRAMGVHDMQRWRPSRRWLHHSEARRREILSDDSWLRFTIVRDPVARLWSAWQSKLLLQEPRFVERFSDEPWFPHRVGSVEELYAAFRAFVTALDVDPDVAPHDAHWGSQTGLLTGFAATWTGRAEDPDASLKTLRRHLEAQGADPERVAGDVPRENANPIPFHPSVYDEATAAITARLYADDLRTWGYPAPTAATDGAPEWRANATAQLRMVGELVERHRRIGDLLAELDAQTKRAARGERAVRDLQGSTSWRLTAPLRRAGAIAREARKARAGRR